jgi:hypothetical protein
MPGSPPKHHSEGIDAIAPRVPTDAGQNGRTVISDIRSLPAALG